MSRRRLLLLCILIVLLLVTQPSLIGQSSLPVPSADSEDLFATSIATSASSLWVGAPGTENQRGAVHHLDTAGELMQPVQLGPPGAGAFGTTVVANDGVVAVSAPFVATVRLYAGDTGLPLATLTPPTPLPYFGDGLAITEEAIYVSSAAAGTMHLFSRQGVFLDSVTLSGPGIDYVGQSPVAIDRRLYVDVQGILPSTGGGAAILVLDRSSLETTAVYELFPDPSYWLLRLNDVSELGFGPLLCAAGLRDTGSGPGTGEVLIVGTSGRIHGRITSPSDTDGFGADCAVFAGLLLVGAPYAGEVLAVSPRQGRVRGVLKSASQRFGISLDTLDGKLYVGSPGEGVVKSYDQNQFRSALVRPDQPYSVQLRMPAKP